MFRFEIDPRDPRPIWRQIEESIQHGVAARLLPPAGRLPSVRDLAKELRVNPATVAKAYRRLADAGVLQVARGDGTYVAPSPPPLASGEQDRLLEEAARRFASVAVSLGVGRSRAERHLRSSWRALEQAEEVRK